MFEKQLDGQLALDKRELAHLSVKARWRPLVITLHFCLSSDLWLYLLSFTSTFQPHTLVLWVTPASGLRVTG